MAEVDAAAYAKANAEYEYAKELCSRVIPMVKKRHHNLNDLKWLVYSNEQDSTKPTQICRYEAISTDSQGTIPVRVKAVWDKAASQITIEWTPVNTKSSSNNSSNEGVRICNNLMSDITSKYDVSNLKLLYANYSQYVSCVYSASKSELYGDRPIQLTVLFNRSNNRYTVESRW